MGNGGTRCALASLDGDTVSNVSSGFEGPALARHKNSKTCPGSSSWIPTPTRSPPPPPVRLRPMGRLAPSLEVSGEDRQLRRFGRRMWHPALRVELSSAPKARHLRVVESSSLNGVESNVTRFGDRFVLIRSTVARPHVGQDQGILTSTISSTDPSTNSPSAPA